MSVHSDGYWLEQIYNLQEAASNDKKAIKTVAFDGAANNGAQGTVPLFTVTGDIMLRIVAICNESLAGASATIEVGVAGNTAGILAQVLATNVVNNDVWVTGSSPVGLGSMANSYLALANGLDIIATVATADITNGTLKFYAVWRPLSADGNLVAA